MTRRSTAVRVAAVSAALLALVAIVALASGRERPGPGGDVTDAESFLALKDGFFTVVVTAYVVTVGAVLVFLLRRRRRWQPPDRRYDLRSLVTFLLFVFALMVVVFNAPPGLRERFESWGLARMEQAEPEARSGPEAALDADRAAEFSWPVAAALVGLLGAGAAAVVVLRRRGRAEARLAPVGVAEELATVVDEAIADVGRESDPRRAVIAAYAQMERAVGASGVPRRPHEAPFEYLARMLGELRVRPAAVLALTELFERARFSTHRIDSAMRDEALDALAAVRDDLRGAAAA